MNKFFYLPVFILAGLFFILSSCSSHVSYPALYHHDIAYQPKPLSSDSSKTAFYILGGYFNKTNADFNDQMGGASLDLSMGHTFEFLNLSYGAFTELGQYKNTSLQQTDTNYFSTKHFGAIGGRASADFFITSGSTDFRFIGIEAAYSHEYGSYAAYRKYVYNHPFNSDLADERTDLLTAGLTSEIIFHGSRHPNFQMGARLFIGRTFGNFKFYNPATYNSVNQSPYPYSLDGDPSSNPFYDITLFFKYRKVFGTADLAVRNFNLRMGLAF